MIGIKSEATGELQLPCGLSKLTDVVNASLNISSRRPVARSSTNNSYAIGRTPFTEGDYVISGYLPSKLGRVGVTPLLITRSPS